MPITFVVRKSNPQIGGIDAYTEACLHFDGNFTNAKPGGLPIFTDYGSPSFNTSIKKFGSASVEWNGSDSYIIAAISEIYSTPWTVDFWLRHDSGSQGSAFQMPGSSTYGVVNCWVNDAGVELNWSLNGSSWDGPTASIMGVSTSEFRHYEINYDSDNKILRGFVNGVLTVNETLSSQLHDGANTIEIGRYSNGVDTYYYISDWMDEFRLSIGIVRHTTNFTPPAYAYTT